MAKQKADNKRIYTNRSVDAEGSGRASESGDSDEVGDVHCNYRVV